MPEEEVDDNKESEQDVQGQNAIWKRFQKWGFLSESLRYFLQLFFFWNFHILCSNNFLAKLRLLIPIKILKFQVLQSLTYHITTPAIITVNLVPFNRWLTVRLKLFQIRRKTRVNKYQNYFHFCKF